LPEASDLEEGRQRPQSQKVSTIIPTYCRPATLVKAIESALRQTYENHEVIVIDDGSTSETATAVRPYLDRIRYFRQNNQGVAAVLNKGLEVATGNWIAVLADDDLWLPTKLESQIKAMAGLGDEFGACFTNCVYVGDPSRTLSVFDEANVECRCEFEPLAHPLRYVLAKKPALYVQAMVARRSLLEELNGFDRRLTVGEDTDMILRLALRTRFCVVCTPLVQINRSPDIPRLTNLYDSDRETIFACIEYKYHKWLNLPELSEPAIRLTIHDHLNEIYYRQVIGSIYKFNLTGAFGKIRELHKEGLPYPTIFATLLFRTARRIRSAITRGGVS
jgi:glycosyltransferase involved in cell wall biosynthesis